MKTTAIEDLNAARRDPEPASRARAFQTRTQEVNHHPTLYSIVKLTLSTSLCGLALLFATGCSDRTPPPTAATPPAWQPKTPVETQKVIPEEDVAFFEKKYQRKITGVKPKSEYADPDQFYSAIAVQLGIPEMAWEAAAAKFGWKKDDGKVTQSMVKGGPTAAGGQGTWDVMFIRFAVNTETKRPDPGTMESKMVQLDYDGNIKFPEIPKENR